MKYSYEIIQVKNGSLIRNYNVLNLYIIYILFNIFLCFPIIDSIIYGILDKNPVNYFSNIILPLIFNLLLIVIIINYIKEITINLNDNKIVFKYGLIPFVKTKVIYINEINEISINYLTENKIFHVYKMKEKKCYYQRFLMKCPDTRVHG